MEAVVALIVLVTPWLFGGYLPLNVFATNCALALLLVLWTLKQCIRWRLTLHRCGVSIALMALFVTSALALIAVPPSVMNTVSPKTGSLYAQLLPATREVPDSGPVVEALPYAPGTTLSLYPSTTQSRLLDLLAVLVLFVVVRHSLASPERFRRLAYLLVINGGLLAVFGLWQKVRSPANVVYGMTVEGAQTFGPFINRNHFAMYVNCCVCLGMGLFLANLQRARGEYAAEQRNRFSPTQYFTNPLTDILHHPSAAWVLVPIAVGITGVLASLSRGGMLALALAAVLGALALRKKGRHVVIPLIAIPLVALGILAWYGAEPTLQRIDQEHLATEGRFTIWRASWEAIKDFPLVGTGLGTFLYVEPLYRPASANQDMMILHAHNEYIEALVEGGVVRFVLTLLLVALVLRLGWRAARYSQRTRDQLLAAGGWAACVTVAAHSVGEFGVHLPAIAAVLAVIAAHLTAMGATAREREEDSTLIRFHYFGVGPILGALVALTLAFALVSGSWQETRSERHRNAGLVLRHEAKGDPEKLARAVRQLDASIQLTPAHFRVRMERFETETQRLQALAASRLTIRGATEPVEMVTHFAAALGRTGAEPLASLTEVVTGPVAGQFASFRWFTFEQRDSWREQARHLLAARDLCPIAWRPHLEIAQHVATSKTPLTHDTRFRYWAKSDSHEAYLNRVKLLLPNRAETWYLCGEQEGLTGRRADAIASWRRSLELSDEFLDPIIQQAAKESKLSVLQPDLQLTTEEIMQDLLPPQSTRSLVRVAWSLYPGVVQINERRPYLEKAIAMLDRDPNGLEPEKQHLYGLALWGLNKREQAVQHIRESINKDPGKSAWRLDLARLYFELQRLADAREQLAIVLREMPGNVEAHGLQEKLNQLQRPNP
jgi:O-antigen ligase/tetratricopeptide (TPR) repeat protein